MKQTSKPAGAALTATQEQKTKATRICTPTWAKFEWQTFDDANLARMEQEAGRFLGEIQADTAPRWLSFLGEAGIGKTYLARQVYRLAAAHFGNYICPQKNIVQKRAVRFVDWRVLADQFRAGEHYRTTEVANAWFLVLDDIGTEYDPNGFLASRIDRILNARLGKWTILTSNLDIQGIADRLDIRVADRMMRDANKVCDVSTKSFALR